MYGHVLKTARFTNNSRNVVVAEWADEKDESIVRESHVSVSERDKMFKNLLSHITLDKIEENTVEYGKQRAAMMTKFYQDVYEKERQIKKAAQKNGEVIVYDHLIDFIFRYNAEEDDEVLFDLKLAIFDMPEITADENDDGFKESIRTAKTPMELVYLLAESGLFPNMPRKAASPAKKKKTRRPKKAVDSNLDSEQT